MSETDTIQLAEAERRAPGTVPSLMHDLGALGVQSGMTLLVHSSLSRMGWISGGPVAVILALEELLGEKGTLVMPTHTGALSDPAEWRNPPVPEAWWETIRETMPAYVPALTPSYKMGLIPETFRKQEGVVRSGHPQTSFAARGSQAAFVTEDHALTSSMGEQSPLARIYDLEGWVLLLGVGHANNTSLHLAEYRANWPGKNDMRLGAPIYVEGQREWVWFYDVDGDDSDFAVLGTDFERHTAVTRRGIVGCAEAILFPQRALVDYAVEWMEHHRNWNIK